MFCPKCGKINPDEGNLCTGCGATLEENAISEKKVKKGLGKIVGILVTVILIVAICFLAVSLTGCGAPQEYDGEDIEIVNF